ncbi:family 76 glycoside hydrolase [Microdochium bolleyi]|uniref:Mannan endo-1,6-alpha-mannosidase n=1 Tax=Microdochium bolleyi TaxID=196109 RepID=A0A136JCT9_9PEZI|nr:family 76 glycoside hydrolase [Microdochium bolleyi]
MSFYPPYNGVLGWTTGILPGPPPNGLYYWWQGGAMWGTLLDYRHQTGDKQFDRWISEAMLAQVGDKFDYNPRNWSASMGNDDQAFWAMSALIAAETGYTDPPKDQPQWLALAQGTLHSQMNMQRRVAANANSPCAWGLRWQVYQTNNGWDYINTISNGCFMNMAARVGRYTGNTTYFEWAEKTWDFIRGLKYVADDYQVYDGAHEPTGCQTINPFTFSYNAAVLMQSCAYMYNATNGADKWKQQIDGLLNRTIVSFFGETGVAFERNCEGASTGCNTDMRSFKGYLHRWMASTMKLAPYTAPTIMPVLRSSAKAALKTCTGGTNGRMCGFQWRSGEFVGPAGAGEQMNVLGALMSVMNPADIRAPLTNATGGTSGGSLTAGTGGDMNIFDRSYRPITTGDRAGAGIATAVLLGLFLSTMAWLNWDQFRSVGSLH